MVRIIGLDPGLQHTGWGVILRDGATISHVAHGVISPPNKDPLPQRLTHLFQALSKVIEMHQPHDAAVEETFVNKNPQSTLKLGMARGVVLFCPAHYKLDVAEYAANKIKKTIVGTGHATKDQMIHMVNMLLPTAKVTQSDAADALATAITHAHHLMGAMKGMTL